MPVDEFTNKTSLHDKKNKTQNNQIPRIVILFGVVTMIAVIGVVLIGINKILAQNSSKPDNPQVAGVSDTKKIGESRIYPDPIKTPGDVLPRVTEKDICQSGYSATVRSVSESQKKRIYEKYGITYPVNDGDYEVDHFISLQIGGSNDDTNLWPEPANPKPGFHEKDIAENYLKRLVCDKKISLKNAQERMQNDWYREYLNWKQTKSNKKNN